jgi:hypothetical protein
MVLLSSMLLRLREEEGQPDIILIPGDFVAHGIAGSEYNTGNYTLLMQVIKETSLLIHNTFPRALMLPQFGNNDVKNHYMPPLDEEKTEYYGQIFSYWFEIQQRHPVL